MWNPLTQGIPATRTDTEAQPELGSVVVIALGGEDRAPTALVCDTAGQVTAVPFAALRLDVPTVQAWAGTSSPALATAGGPPDDRQDWSGSRG